MKAQDTQLDALVESILERSGDRSARDLLQHMPCPDEADLFRVQAAVLARIRAREAPRPRRWLPLVMGFAAATAAAGAWGVLGWPERAPAPAAPQVTATEVPAQRALEVAAEAASAVPAGAEALREAYRLLNRGAGDAAALAVVERGLAAAEHGPLRLLQIALLERLGRTSEALTAAQIYLAAGWPEQRREVAEAAARFEAGLPAAPAGSPER